MKFNSNKSPGAVIVEPIDWSKGTASAKILEGIQNSLPDNSTPIDFLMVAGDGRDDEVVFQWANDLYEKKIVPNVSTISVAARNTQARYTLTQGVTGKPLQPKLMTHLTENQGVLTALQRLGQLSSSGR